jgi:L-fuconolactonase
VSGAWLACGFADRPGPMQFDSEQGPPRTRVGSMNPEELNIVDSQVHVWAANTPERPWVQELAGVSHGPDSVSPAEIIDEMDRAGVTAAMLVPPSFEGDRNDLALEAARSYPGRFCVLGRFALSRDNAPRTIASAMEEPSLVGVRITFNATATNWLEEGTVEWFWGFAADRGIRVSLFPLGRQLDLVAEIAQRHPRLKLSIDHLACGHDPADCDSVDAIRRLAPLAKYPNVAVKASALPNCFPTTYSAERVREVIDLVLSLFGPKRVFWGSDLTQAPAAYRDYRASLQVFLDGIEHLPESLQRSIMGDALREWFDWRS